MPKEREREIKNIILNYKPKMKLTQFVISEKAKLVM